MPKAIVNPRRFSHCKAFRKIRKALINKEKTSNHNGLLAFAVLVELGGPNKNLWCFAGGIALSISL
jgi:hypothetical protein